jgi:UDP-N-acetylmuramate--alanine ligase
MNLTEAKNVFMIGINGSGMRGLAYVLAQDGKKISGTDATFTDDNLREWTPHQVRGDGVGSFSVATEDSAGPLLVQSDLVIHSDAVAADHPLLKLAHEKGIKAVPYQEAVGQFASGFSNIIAVAGTHGKSSTTAMLAHIFIQAGANPTVLVGASIPAWEHRNAYAGGKEYFIVEADEYREHFLYLNPTHAIITNIEFDHPDYFHSLEEVEKAFEKFEKSVRKKWITRSSRVMTQEKKVQLALPGKHMQENASLAAEMASEILGISSAEALAFLATFTGLGRRFELIGTLDGKDVYSDYGHHPTEILATLKAAKEAFAGKKILVVVEVHTIERLRALFADFISCLRQADGIVVVPVFRPKGREELKAEDKKLEDEYIEQLTKGSAPVWSVQDYRELKGTLAEAARGYDVILAFTAGYLDATLRQIVS